MVEACILGFLFVIRGALVVCESICRASTVHVIKKFPVDDIVWRLVLVVSTIACMLPKTLINF